MTLCDLMAVFAEKKSCTKSRLHCTFLQIIKIILIFNKYSNQLKFQIVEKPFTTIHEPQTDMAKKCKCLEQFGNPG